MGHLPLWAFIQRAGKRLEIGAIISRGLLVWVSGSDGDLQIPDQIVGLFTRNTDKIRSDLGSEHPIQVRSEEIVLEEKTPRNRKKG